MIPTLTVLWSEKMLDMVSIFLNLLRVVLWPNTCDLALLRNLYVDQEATVRTLHGTTDSSKLRKEYAAAAAAAAAKLLQSCLTLCNPIDGSPPGSPSLGF